MFPLLVRSLLLLTLALAFAAVAPAFALQEPAEQERAAEAENELHRAIEQAGNDRAALVRNLEDYLRRFPDAPRRVQVYRALVEAAIQLRDYDRAVDYAERIVALRPDDSSMLLLAVDLLEQRGDPHSLTRAVGYVTRVLDRVEKARIEEKSPRVSQADWDLEQKRLRMSVYLIRGRLEMERRNYDRAREDVEESFRTLPTPAAALRLGELAEVAGKVERAIEHYTTAFVLPDRHGLGIDRREVRRKLGNLWRMHHGSEAGLGEHILAAYDRILDAEEEEDTEAGALRNAGASAVEDFVLRRLEGGEFALAEARGKILVLNFWATWCLPCREMKPQFEQVERSFEDREDVLFLAVSTDADEDRVPPYVQRLRVATPVVFADGLNEFLGVRSIPTVIVLGRDGRILYRAAGFDPASFVADLTNALRFALDAPPEPAPAN